MPDDHSEVVPLLPIPNRTVKRLCADDSAGSRVKVGHRQALTSHPYPQSLTEAGGMGFLATRNQTLPMNRWPEYLLQVFRIRVPICLSAALRSSSFNSWRNQS